MPLRMRMRTALEFGLYLDSYDETDQLLHTQTSSCALSGVYRGEPFKEHFDEMASSYLVINKLFRRAFLEQYHLRFPCHQLGEDGLFYVAFYRQNPGCLLVLEKPLYHYMIARQGSLSNRYHPERLEDNFYLSDAVWDTVAAWACQNSPCTSAKANYCTVRDLMDGVKNLAAARFSCRADCLATQCAAKAPRAHSGAQHPAARHAEPERPGQAAVAQAATVPRGAAALGRKSAQASLKRNAKIPPLPSRQRGDLLPI